MGVINACSNLAFVRFWAVAGLILALLLPLVLTNYWTSVANQVFIAVIGALALNLLMGYDRADLTRPCRLHGGRRLHGRGSDDAVRGADRRDARCRPRAGRARCWACWSGLPALRLKGLYLAVSTLAAHFVIIVGVGQYQSAISYGSGFTIPPPTYIRLDDRFGTRVVLLSSAGRARGAAE